jgi:glycosyltransferase involved in cell wall biosynthesis
LKSRVGIVVPTLGERNNYLLECLESIKNSGSGTNRPFVVLVAPKHFEASSFLKLGLVDKVIADPGSGLAAAINIGFNSLPSEIDYINWLGDDDLLLPKAMDLVASRLDAKPSTVMVFGGCNYIDANGKKLWTNSSGYWAVPLLRFGPDLVPQPGALFRRSVYSVIGGLNSAFRLAFDFDFFIKVSKIGKLEHIKETLACFRWHPESLSVTRRRESVADASMVRVSHLPPALRGASFIWEYPVRITTFLAGYLVTFRAMKGRDKA